MFSWLIASVIPVFGGCVPPFLAPSCCSSPDCLPLFFLPPSSPSPSPPTLSFPSSADSSVSPVLSSVRPPLSDLPLPLPQLLTLFLAKGTLLSLHAEAIMYIYDNRLWFKHKDYRTRGRTAGILANFAILFFGSFLTVAGTYGSMWVSSSLPPPPRPDADGFLPTALRSRTATQRAVRSRSPAPTTAARPDLTTENVEEST